LARATASPYCRPAATGAGKRNGATGVADPGVGALGVGADAAVQVGVALLQPHGQADDDDEPEATAVSGGFWNLSKTVRETREPGAAGM
jgi:hypothetical protein